MVEFMNPVLRRKARGAMVVCVVAAGVLLAGGCSGTVEDLGSDRQPTYKSSRSAPPLEIPPDLTSSAVRDALPIPGVGATYSQYADDAGSRSGSSAVPVLQEVEGARIERNGAERWLVVEMMPEEVWPRIRDFWTAQGLALETEEPDIGIMETEWAERRTPLPGHAVKKLFQRVYEAFYGVAFRDRYRTRIERGAGPGSTDIYIAHRGAEQVVLGEERSGGDGPLEWVWQPRPNDPGLEAEMLSRLLVFLGVDEERADSIVAEQEAPAGSRVRLEREGGVATAVVLGEAFSPAWRSTGLALDRAGFVVEDRDRSRGLFFVRYTASGEDGSREEGGWLSRLQFWKSEDDDEGAGTYLVRVVEESPEATRIVVLDEEGTPDRGSIASRILTVLHEQLQ